MVEDDEQADHEDDLECDCTEEEVDVLTGVAHCWRCGSRRYLGSEEFARSLKIEAQFQEDYARHIEECERSKSFFLDAATQ
jgi:hypothetical protein